MLLNSPLNLQCLFILVILVQLSSGHSDEKYDHNLVKNKIWPIAAAALAKTESDIVKRLNAIIGNVTSVKQFSHRVHSKKIIIPWLLTPSWTYDISCFIAVSHSEKAIILSFRGNDGGPGQYADEIETGLFTTEAIVGNEKFDEKIAIPFMTYHKFLEKKYMPYLIKMSEVYSNYSHWIVGHSLGGALASIGAFALGHTRKEALPRIKLYTFGQPRTGNKQFCNWIEQNVPTVYRVTHGRDPIPRLPFENCGLLTQILNACRFAHHGVEIYYPGDMTEPNFEECVDNSDSKACGLIKAHGNLEFFDIVKFKALMDEHNPYFPKKYVKLQMDKTFEKRLG